MSDIPYKVVLVGCGNMSKAWLEASAARSDVKVVGVVDLAPQVAQQRAEQYKLGPGAVFESLGKAIKATKPDIVFDVTIPEAHDKVTIQALRAGCHVLGEKPMTVSMQRAKRMIAAADKAGKVYAVIQNRRYIPPIRQMRAIVESGEIGRLAEIHADFFLAPHFGGFRDVMDYPLIVDMAIHTFDQARFMTGLDPVAVYCHSFNPKHSWYKGDASAIITFEMTDDVVFSYRGSWCAEGLRTSWQSHWRLIGAGGTVMWSDDTVIRGRKVTSAGATGKPTVEADITVPAVSDALQGHAGVIDEFVGCIKAGTRPQTDCHDNIKSLAMVLAAVKSARTGRRVPVAW